MSKFYLVWCVSKNKLKGSENAHQFGVVQQLTLFRLFKNSPCFHPVIGDACVQIFKDWIWYVALA